MTIQRSKQLLVQGYIKNVKRRKMMTVLLETHYCQRAAFTSSRVHVGGSRAVDKIHRMIKNSSRDSPAHTHVHAYESHSACVDNAPDNDCPGCLLAISSRSRLSDAEAIEPSD